MPSAWKLMAPPPGARALAGDRNDGRGVRAPADCIPYDGAWQLFIYGGHNFNGSPYSIGALVDNLRLVPEPGTLALLGPGLVALVLSRRRTA